MKPDIIARIGPAWQSENWQKLLAEAIRDPAELLQWLELPDSLLPSARRAAQLFPLRVPLGYLERIEKGNPHDPLLLQVLPLQAELNESEPAASHDPVGDSAASPVPGLIHKYQGRVLLISTGACAIHCRYCFRRHFPYGENSASPSNHSQIIDYINNNLDIEEIILSGGDPLSLTTERLRNLTEQLTALPHIKRLRIHTRLPVVLPQRIDNPFLDWLSSHSMKTITVIHCNHPHELGQDTREALLKLSQTGTTLLNQAVLLRGVNDSTETLRRLSEELFASGVMPYYLHQLDRVTGACHFAVPDARAQHLLESLNNSLPGYLVPKLVREIEGAPAKQGLPINN